MSEVQSASRVTNLMGYKTWGLFQSNGESQRRWSKIEENVQKAESNLIGIKNSGEDAIEKMLINLARESFAIEKATYKKILTNQDSAKDFLNALESSFEASLGKKGSNYLSQSYVGEDTFGTYITKMFYGLTDEQSQSSGQNGGSTGRADFIKQIADFNIELAFSGELNGEQIFKNMLQDNVDNLTESINAVRTGLMDRMTQLEAVDDKGKRGALRKFLSNVTSTKIAKQATAALSKNNALLPKSSGNIKNKIKSLNDLKFDGRDFFKSYDEVINEISQNYIETLQSTINAVLKEEEGNKIDNYKIDIAATDAKMASSTADIAIKMVDRVTNTNGIQIEARFSDRLSEKIQQAFNKEQSSALVQQEKILDQYQGEIEADMNNYIENAIKGYDQIIYDYLRGDAKEFFQKEIRSYLHQRVRDAVNKQPSITKQFKTEGGLFREVRIIYEGQNKFQEARKQLQEQEQLLEQMNKDTEQIEKKIKEIKASIAGYTSTVRGALGEIYGTLLISYATGMDVTQEGLSRNLLGQEGHADEIIHNVEMESPNGQSKIINVGIQAKNFTASSTTLYDKSYYVIGDIKRYIAATPASAEDDLAAFRYLFMAAGLRDLSLLYSFNGLSLVTTSTLEKILSLRMTNFMRYTDVFQSIADSSNNNQDPIIRNNFFQYHFNIIPTSALFIQLLQQIDQSSFNVTIDYDAYNQEINSELNKSGDEGTNLVPTALFGNSGFKYKGIAVNITQLLGKAVF